MMFYRGSIPEFARKDSHTDRTNGNARDDMFVSVTTMLLETCACYERRDEVGDSTVIVT